MPSWRDSAEAAARSHDTFCRALRLELEKAKRLINPKQTKTQTKGENHAGERQDRRAF